MDSSTEAELPEDVAAALKDPRRRLGRYVLVDELGRGAMGLCWRGFDIELKRFVAIKTFARFDADAERRLLREAQAAARLRHPGIVTVHDVAAGDGRPYVVMELVRGKSLDSMLEPGALPPRRAAEIARDVAYALAHAHERGVVHRDVKPGNILVDEEGRPRLVDFGLARDDLATSRLSRTGDVIGTPFYMAPEQAVGETRWHGPHTDVYGLGAVLYHMLAGRSPFSDAMSLPALIDAVRLQAPEPPSKWHEGIPATLDRIVLHCLAKGPEQRPGAEELASSLDSWLGGAVFKPARGSLRGHGPPLLLLALVAVLIVVAVALALVVRSRSDAPGPASPSVPPAAPSNARASPQPPPAARPRAVSTSTQLLPEPYRKCATSRAGHIRIVDVYRAKDTAAVLALALSPLEDRLAVADATTKASVLDARTGERLRDLAAHSPTTAVDWYADDERLLAGTAAGTILVWDMRRPDTVAEIGRYRTPVRAVATIGSGSRAVSSDQDGHLRLHTSDGQAEFHVQHFSPVVAIAIDLERMEAVCGYEEGAIRTLELDHDLAPHFTALPGLGAVRACAVGPGGRPVLAGLQSGAIWIGSPGGAAVVREHAHADEVACARFVSATRALTGSHDRTVRLWDATSGVELDALDLGPTEDRPSALAVARDGKRAFVGTVRGVVLVLEVD